MFWELTADLRIHCWDLANGMKMTFLVPSSTFERWYIILQIWMTCFISPSQIGFIGFIQSVIRSVSISVGSIPESIQSILTSVDGLKRWTDLIRDWIDPIKNEVNSYETSKQVQDDILIIIHCGWPWRNLFWDCLGEICFISDGSSVIKRQTAWGNNSLRNGQWIR